MSNFNAERFLVDARIVHKSMCHGNETPEVFVVNFANLLRGFGVIKKSLAHLISNHALNRYS